MVQLGLAILLPDAVHNRIRSLQLTAAVAAAGNPALRITPHVTLKQPFHAKSLEPVVRYFDEVVAAFDPVEIHLQGLDVFDDDRVIFASVAPNAALERHRLAILKEIGQRFKVRPRDVEGEKYRFHCTIAYNLTPEQFPLVRQALASESVDVQFPVRKVALFYYTGDVWIELRRAPIGRPAGG